MVSKVLVLTWIECFIIAFKSYNFLISVSHTNCILHLGNVHWMDALLSGKQHSSDSYHDILDLIIFASTGLVILVSQVDSQILLFVICESTWDTRITRPVDAKMIKSRMSWYESDECWLPDNKASIQCTFPGCRMQFVWETDIRKILTLKSNDKTFYSC